MAEKPTEDPFDLGSCARAKWSHERLEEHHQRWREFDQRNAPKKHRTRARLPARLMKKRK